MEEIRLYQRTTADLEDPAVFETYFEQIPQARKEKIRRLKNREDRKRSLAAGILLCKGLADLGVDGSKVRIAVEEHGRPYLPDFPGIHFSLSHSGGMALAAFSKWEVGCDIEEVKIPNLKVAKRFFCPEEQEWIRQAKKRIRREAGRAEEPGDTQTKRFYRLWTLKESFLKATGCGLSLPMDSFCFSFTPAPGLRQDFDAAQYLFGEYRCGEYDEKQKLIFTVSEASGPAVDLSGEDVQTSFSSGALYLAAVCLRRPAE